MIKSILILIEEDPETYEEYYGDKFHQLAFFWFHIIAFFVFILLMFITDVIDKRHNRVKTATIHVNPAVNPPSEESNKLKEV